MIFTVLCPDFYGAAAPADDLPRVRADIDAGRRLVGQGFQLRVAVVASSVRPKVDTPKIAGARVWPIATELTPISASGIGSKINEVNQYVFRFRVVPLRAGKLEIPSIVASVNGQSGRSRPKTVAVESPPLSGRPAEFMGGVGSFELTAQAVPAVVRVGQELEYRIKVTGPAAWGIIARPELGRLGQRSVGLRVEPQTDETTDEPPARTFVYRLRPTEPGEIVVPPVAIASFDPSIARYIMRVTNSVAIRAVAVPAFDGAALNDDSAATVPASPRLMAWIATISFVALAIAYALLNRVRSRLVLARSYGLSEARRFARRASHQVLTDSRVGSGRSPAAVARTVHDTLARYLLLGTGEELAVLTPEEARAGLVRLTNSESLAAEASELAMRCDAILYDELNQRPEHEAERIRDDARRLFESLGRVKLTSGQTD